MPLVVQYTWVFDADAFSKACKRGRFGTGLTQKEVSEMLGFHSAVSNAENPPQGWLPSMGLFLQLCNLYDVPPGLFFTAVVNLSDDEMAQLRAHYTEMLERGENPEE